MLVGHQQQWRYLQKSAAKKCLAHAYLFYGPSKVGKKTAALQFAKIINCFNSDTEPCNDCPSCREIDNNVSANMLFLGETAENEQIYIDQIRELKTKMSLSASGEGYKIAVIDSPKINADAQGALLKLLEEPQGRTVMILVAKSISQFLPTIVSRCQPVRFSLVRGRQIEEYLLQEKVPAQKAKEMAQFSFGKPGLAIDSLRHPEVWKFQQAKIGDIKNLSAAPFYKKFQYAQEAAKDVFALHRTIEIWLNYFRALLLRKPHSSRKLRETINFLEKMRILLATTNVNPRLALEVFLLKI